MTQIRTSLQTLPSPNPDGISEFEMAVGNAVLTRLIRPDAAETVDFVRVPAAPLGFWIADHWWRLRWEPKPSVPSVDWQMAHEMNAIGHGHSWPPITIWGDRDRVTLVSRADLPAVAGPARFLTNAVTFAPAIDFEAAMDHLLDAALDAASLGNRAALTALVNALREERGSPGHAKWRRIEAISGHDPDEAPETLITALLALESTYAPEDIEEAVASAAGDTAAATLSASIERAERSPVFDFTNAMMLAKLSRPEGEVLEPWVAAENAAETLRRALGKPTQPILSKALADISGVSPDHLKDHPPTAVPYALRLARSDGKQVVMLTARWSRDRRFQLARAIGDAIWTNGSSLGPISNVATARQKFQRAFAAALLCPIKGLIKRLGTSNPTDSDISEAAHHFHVNEKTVRTVLVNKQMMERRRLGQPLSDPLDASRLDDVVEAA